MSFQHNSARKNLCSSTCVCWDARFSVRELFQKFKICESFGYGDSFLKFSSRLFKVIRLHSIVHATARTVPSRSGKGPGNCYTTGRGPNSCMLGHVTGLLICLFKKLSLPTIFNYIDF